MGQLRKTPSTFSPAEMWKALTGLPHANTKHMKVGDVHHPSIRYLLKFLGFLFGRTETNQARTVDLLILGSFLRPNEVRGRVDLAYVLMVALESTAKANPTIDSNGNLTSNLPITISGVITQIASRFGFLEGMDGRVGGNAIWLDIHHFSSSKLVFLHSPGRYQWMVGGHEALLLPSGSVGPVHPNANYYLIDENDDEDDDDDDDDGDENEEGDNDEEEDDVPLRIYRRRTFDAGTSSQTQPQPHHQPPPQTQPRQPHYSNYQQQVLDSLGSITLGMGHLSSEITQIREDQTRLREERQRDQQENVRGMYPLYDFAYRQGIISQNIQHPAWYTPPPMQAPHQPFQQPFFQGWDQGRGYGQSSYEPHQDPYRAPDIPTGRDDDDGDNGSDDNGDDVFRQINEYHYSDDD